MVVGVLRTFWAGVVISAVYSTQTYREVLGNAEWAGWADANANEYLMNYMLSVVAVLFSVCANAQFIKHIDENGNVSYTDDPQYDYSQDERDDSEINNELEEIKEYLKERDEAAKLEQAKKQSRKSSIGIGRDLTGVSQRPRPLKCRSLWRMGLKCL
jgi:glutaredoxin-related protein